MLNALNDFTEKDSVAAQYRLLLVNKFIWQIEQERRIDIRNSTKGAIKDFLICFLIFLLACFIICLPVIISS